MRASAIFGSTSSFINPIRHEWEPPVSSGFVWKWCIHHGKSIGCWENWGAALDLRPGSTSQGPPRELKLGPLVGLPGHLVEFQSNSVTGVSACEQLSGCTDPRRPITSTFPAHILHLPRCSCQSTSLHANSQDSVSQLNYEHLFAHWRIGKWLSSASASSCSSRLAGTARTAR